MSEEMISYMAEEVAMDGSLGECGCSSRRFNIVAHNLGQKDVSPRSNRTPDRPWSVPHNNVVERTSTAPIYSCLPEYNTDTHSLFIIMPRLFATTFHLSPRARQFSHSQSTHGCSSAHTRIAAEDCRLCLASAGSTRWVPSRETSRSPEAAGRDQRSPCERGQDRPG